MKKSICISIVNIVLITNIAAAVPTVIDFTSVDSFLPPDSILNNQYRIDRIGDATFSHDLYTHPDCFLLHNGHALNWYGEKREYFTFDKKVFLISLELNGLHKNHPMADTIIFELYDINQMLITTKTVNPTPEFETIFFHQKDVSEVIIDFTGGTIMSDPYYGDDRYHAWYVLDKITFFPTMNVPVDIKPSSCPNPFNVNSKGVLPVAILGSEILDVNDIDLNSLEILGVQPIRSNVEDVATPLFEEAFPEDCLCITDGPDGYPDLSLKFNKPEIVEAIGEVEDGDYVVLMLTGSLKDATPIEGTDCVVIIKKGKQ